MIRRQKMTVFVDAKETSSVSEIKKIVEGITKVAPENQRLYKDDTIMEDTKSLGDYGLTNAIAKAQQPAGVGLTYRQENGSFEPLQIDDLSRPPDLPDVMKPQENTTHEPNV